MPGIMFKFLAAVPVGLMALFAGGLISNAVTGSGPVYINGGVILFFVVLGGIANWLWREGVKRQKVEREYGE